MKKLIIAVLIALCGTATYASPGIDNISHDDFEKLKKAVALVDEGLSEQAMPDFDLLAEKYPDNYLVQYERMFCLSTLQRYDEVVKGEKDLLKHKDATPLAYHMIGNAYDLLGKRKNAIKIYNEGLKRFPDSGALYMELGTVSLMDKDYNKALEYYNKGIVAQPDFASNYYRAASIYLSSNNMKVWGLVYAEAAILLAPGDETRMEQMSDGIIECLKNNISFSNDGLKVTLVPARNITLNTNNDNVYLDFQGIYEGAISQPLKKMYDDHTALIWNIDQLAEIRKGLVDAYYTITNNLYGNSMYLLEFWKQVIDAGHWEAYNYFLFKNSFGDEFNPWYSHNGDKMLAFIEWYNNRPFHLGDGRSVSISQIYNSYRPVNFIESIHIQAELLTDKDSEPD